VTFCYRNFFFLAEKINFRSTRSTENHSTSEQAGQAKSAAHNSRDSDIMSSDEIVWQVINQQFCSYKLK
jgi:hypothetical protein